MGLSSANRKSPPASDFRVSYSDGTECVVPLFDYPIRHGPHGDCFAIGFARGLDRASASICVRFAFLSEVGELW